MRMRDGAYSVFLVGTVVVKIGRPALLDSGKRICDSGTNVQFSNPGGLRLTVLFGLEKVLLPNWLGMLDSQGVSNLSARTYESQGTPFDPSQST